MAGAWHPLVAHLVGALALELPGGSFSLRLGVEHRLLGTLAGLLSAGGSGAKHGHEAANGCDRGEYLSVTCHGGWDHSFHLFTGRNGLYVLKCQFANESLLTVPAQR